MWNQNSYKKQKLQNETEQSYSLFTIFSLSRLKGIVASSSYATRNVVCLLRSIKLLLKFVNVRHSTATFMKNITPVLVKWQKYSFIRKKIGNSLIRKC